MNLWKRSLSMFLAIIMVIGMMPANVVYATENEEPQSQQETVPETSECTHTETTKTPVAATCVDAGSETVTCNACNEVVSTKTIDALGHSYVDGDVTLAATCTAVGQQAVTCANCDYSGTKELPMVAHNYVDGACSVCGAKDPEMEKPVEETQAPTEEATEPPVAEIDVTECGDKDHKYTADSDACTVCGHTVANVGKGYKLFIVNGDGTIPYTCDGSKSGSVFSIKSTLEDARTFGNMGPMFGISDTHRYVVFMYEDSTENASFEIGADVTINGNGHKIVCAEGVVVTNNGTLIDATIEKPEQDHEHSYTDTVIAPTFEAEGYTLHSCTCGHSYQDTFVAAKVAVAAVNGTKYETLGAAIAALQSGGTLTIQQSFTTAANEFIELNGKTNVTVEAAEGVEINGDLQIGYHASHTDYNVDKSESTFTVKNLTVKGTLTVLSNDATLVVSGNKAAQLTVKTYREAMNITVNGNILDGSIGTAANSYGMFIVPNATGYNLTVSGNNFANVKSHACVVQGSGDGSAVTAANSITVSGNTFASWGLNGSDNRAAFKIWADTKYAPVQATLETVTDAMRELAAAIAAGNNTYTTASNRVEIDAYGAAGAAADFAASTEPEAPTEVQVATLAELQEALADNSNDLPIVVTETITIPADETVTLNLNGKKITATDNKAANVSYELFYIYGGLTVTGNGTIELTSTSNDTSWAKSSTIFHNRGGVLVIQSGTFTHKGGTGMAYVVDNNANSYGDATTTIKGGNLSSTYIAIRNRMDTYGANGGGNGVATLNIEGGSLSGKYAVWGQVASARCKGNITITGGSFTAAAGKAAVVVDEDTTGKIVTAISGGTFSSDVSDYVVDGFEVKANANGTYGVVAKPPVVVPDDIVDTIVGADANEETKAAIEQVVAQIQNNAALKADDYKPVENRTDVEELVVTLTDMDLASDNAPTKITFNVEPKKNGEKVKNPAEAITFRLPVPSNVTKTHAKVYHDGTEMAGLYEVKGTGASKYIEVSSASFSVFDVVPVDANVASINGTGYATFAEALTAAAAMTGNVVVEIYDKVTWNTALTGSYTSIKFVGKNADAEIYLDVQGYLTATGKEVAFEDLKLSKVAGGHVYDAGFMNLAFGVYSVNKVTYTNCVFLNGAYASTQNVTFTDCTFYRSHDKYGLWAYGDTSVTVDDCTFADIRGIKLFSEGNKKTGVLTVKNTDFTEATGKPAIVLTDGASVTLENNTYPSTGVFELDLDGKPNGTSVTSDVLPTCVNDDGACGVLVDGKIYTTVEQAAAVATEGSTVTLLHESTETVELPAGVTLERNGFTAAGVTVKQPAVTYVAEVNGTKFESFADAVTYANSLTVFANVVLLNDVSFDGDDLYVDMVLDLNGKTMTATGSYVFWFEGGSLVVKDSSAEKTGMIDGSETVGNAFLLMGEESLTIESGKIHANNNVIYSYGSGTTVIVNGGELKSYLSDGNIFYLVGDNDTITVNGGTFQGNVNPYATGLSIKGGVFTADVNSYCAAGYGAVKNSTGMYEIIKVDASNAAAQIGDAYYLTLGAAINAADADDTIVVLKDVTEALSTLKGKIVPADGATVTINATSTSNDSWLYLHDAFEIGEGVTLNLPNDGLFVYYTEEAVIKGHVVVDAVYLAYPGTKLTVHEPGSLTVTSETFIIRYMEGDVDSGLYIVGDNNDATIGVKAEAIYFYQGTISAKDANLQVKVYWQTQETDGQGSANLVLDNSKLNVTSENIFQATGSSTVTLRNGAAVTVASGYQGVNVTMEDTSTFTKNGVSIFQAKVNNVAYTTLADAIAAAESGDTITLLADVTLDAVVVIDKAITLDLNDKTVTGANKAVVFQIKADTIIENGKIAGNKTGTSSGLLEIYADLDMNGVTVETSSIKAMAFKEGGFTAVLTDCTVTGGLKGYGGSVWQIYGGNYYVGSSPSSEHLNGSVEVYSGTFYYELKATDAAPGYVVVKNGETWTVEYDLACFVDADNDGIQDEGEALFGSLEEIFTTYRSGDVYIVLLKDIEIKNQVDTNVNAKYYLNAAEGVTVTFKHETGALASTDAEGNAISAKDQAWNFIQNMYIGENVTLNSKYLLLWGDVEIAGTVNTTYLYTLGATVDVQSTGAVNVANGEATVQVKANTTFTVDGELNAALLQVWNDNAKLVINGDVTATNIRAWDGAPVIIVGKNANVESEKFTLADSATVQGPAGLNITTTVDDHKVNYEGGSYGIVECNYVAQVGEQKFETLAAAIEAAQAGETVTLLADMELTATVTIPTGKDVTLELNGNVISGTCNASQSSLIYIDNGAKLTVKDSSEDESGKITYAQGTSNVGWTVDVKGALVLESGTIELTGTSWNIGYAVDVRPNSWGTAYTQATTFVMEGGNIVSSDGAVRVASSSDAAHKNVAASFTMYGGKIDAAWDGVFVQQSDGIYDDLSVTIEGGTIESDLNPIRVYGPAPTGYVNGQECMSIALEGGTLTYTGTENQTWAVEGILRVGGGSSIDTIIENGTLAVSAAFAQKNVLDGYKWVENSDGTYSIVKCNYVAEVNGTKYESWTEALDALTLTDNVLTLLADVTTNSTINVAKNLTINGKDHTLTYTGSGYVINAETAGTSLTVKNLTIDCTTKYNERAINFNTKETLTLEKVTIKGNVNYAINLRAGTADCTVNITDSNITGNIALNIWGANSTITATNTNFVSEHVPSDTDACSVIKLNNDGSNAAHGTKLIVNGGSIKGNLYAVEDVAAYTEINISSETVVVGDIVEAVAAIMYQNTTDFYTAVTLKQAIDKAIATNGTVLLLKDITISESIKIDSSVDINGDGHKLTYTGNDRAINIPANTNEKVNVTIENLDVDCTANYCERGINYNDDGTLTLNNVTVKGTNVTYALNMPGSSDNAIVVIKDSKLTGNIALNVWGENANITAENTAFTSVDKTEAENYAAVKLNNDGTTNANGTTITITGGEIIARDQKGDPSSAVSNATATGKVNVSESTVVIGEIIVPVAIVTYGTTQFYSMSTLQAAIDKVVKDGNGTVELIANITETSVTVNGNVTMVLNGKNISGEIKLAANAVLTAPAGLNVTTVADHKVVYENSAYSVVECNYVAQVGEQKFESLQDAINAAGAGDTVTLLADLVIQGETYTIADGKSITLDMNGKKITATDDKAANVSYELFYNFGELIVTGNGTIELTSTSNDTSWAKSSTIFHNRGGVLVIENGTYNHLGGTAMAYVVDNSANSYGDATATIKGGTLSAYYVAIRNRMDTHGENGGGNGIATLLIEGGSLSGKRAVWGQVSSKGCKGNITITGGDFSAWEGQPAVLVGTDETGEVKTAISGGTFSSDVTDLCVDGYVAELNSETGKYEIVEEKVELFAIQTSNIVLGNELAMYFYVKNTDLEGEDLIAVVTKTYADDTENVVVEIPYSEWEDTSNNRKRFKFNGIAAKEMGDDIHVYIKNTKGTVLTEVYTDSIQKYVERGFSTGNAQKNGELATMLVDMLNYGAAAQGIFHYNEGHPANENMADYQSHATQSVSLTNGQVKGTGFKSMSAVLESNISLVMFFDKSYVDQRMTAVVTFTDHYGTKHELEIAGSEFEDRGSKGWAVIVNELVVADGCQMVTCKFLDANGVEVEGVYGIDSLESMCARAVAGGGGSWYEDIMKFSISAFNYFH